MPLNLLSSLLSVCPLCKVSYRVYDHKMLTNIIIIIIIRTLQILSFETLLQLSQFVFLFLHSCIEEKRLMCSKAGELNSEGSHCLCFFFLKPFTYLFSLSALYSHSQRKAWFAVFLPNSLPTSNQFSLPINVSRWPLNSSCKCQYGLT